MTDADVGPREAGVPVSRAELIGLLSTVSGYSGRHPSEAAEILDVLESAGLAVVPRVPTAAMTTYPQPIDKALLVLGKAYEGNRVQQWRHLLIAEGIAAGDLLSRPLPGPSSTETTA